MNGISDKKLFNMAKTSNKKIRAVSGNKRSHFQERYKNGRFGAVSVNKVDKADRRDFGKAKSRLLSIKSMFNHILEILQLEGFRDFLI